MFVSSFHEHPVGDPTPRTLGLSSFLGCCGHYVLYVLGSLFPGWVGAWREPAYRGGAGARFHGPRVPLEDRVAVKALAVLSGDTDRAAACITAEAAAASLTPGRRARADTCCT
jgi:hypothetical protein